MRPGDLVGVVGPRSDSRRIVRDDAHRAARPARQLFHPVGRPVGQDDLAGHVFPGVVTVFSTLAHVDQLGGDVRRRTVVGHRSRRLTNVAQLDNPGLDQPELASEQRPVLVYGPGRTLPHGQRDEFHVLEAVALGARLDPLGLVQEPLGFAGGRMVHHQRPQIVIGDVARDFVGQFVVGVFR